MKKQAQGESVILPCHHGVLEPRNSDGVLSESEVSWAWAEAHLLLEETCTCSCSEATSVTSEVKTWLPTNHKNSGMGNRYVQDSDQVEWTRELAQNLKNYKLYGRFI